MYVHIHVHSDKKVTAASDFRKTCMGQMNMPLIDHLHEMAYNIQADHTLVAIAADCRRLCDHAPLLHRIYTVGADSPQTYNRRKSVSNPEPFPILPHMRGIVFETSFFIWYFIWLSAKILEKPLRNLQTTPR